MLCRVISCDLFVEWTNTLLRPARHHVVHKGKYEYDSQFLFGVSIATYFDKKGFDYCTPLEYSRRASQIGARL